MPDLRDGKAVLVVPKEGKLVLRSDKLLGMWHSETASFADGTPIPFYIGNEAILKEDDITICGLFNDTEGRTIYVVDKVYCVRHLRNHREDVYDILSKR